MQVNSSIHDYPELNYFYTQYFLKHESGQEYQDITFEVDWMMEFLKHDQFYEQSIMNIKSMEYFYAHGEQYDQSRDLADLANPMLRFGCTSLQQTRVVWEWLKQIETWFVQRANLNCTGECAGIGLQASSGMIWAFYNMTAYLKPRMVSNMVMNTQDWSDCGDMWSSSIEGITEESMTLICQDYQVEESTLMAILSFCKQKYELAWEQVGVRYNLTRSQLIQMCEQGSTSRSFQTLIENANLEMDQLYDCKYEHCSELDLAIKQWARSQVTLNPPPSSTLTVAYTARDWNPTLYAFEY